ncbi:hypothetical protein QBC46DRAFT_382980 [Diplogelasinospora grovesii]|uniref:Prokaryotic-type class I peptide chain release factors domain-containing protein n=1 Tax=Diplogelasinospora grovesii TaxID=303347 RepID=A0AAN6N8X2_9PEZI|nr:hypothetical protein QBC46DRAFT_382980 [Diplogelasinospora grovesii]
MVAVFGPVSRQIRGMERLYFGLRSTLVASLIRPVKSISAVTATRSVRFQAFDAAFDQDELAEARTWRQSFLPSSLPEGDTSFSRSSGPGGQHVNKTETKATTTWPVSKLLAILPRMLHPGIRSSKYYAKGSDCITIQAQDHRSRTANTKENHLKLFNELQRLYEETVPNETSPDKKHKYEALQKSANEARMRMKKQQGSKKASRKGGADY